MTPSHTAKGSRRYRYYVSQAVLQGRPTGPIRRIAAHAIEAIVIAALRAAPALSVSSASSGPINDAELIAGHLGQVTVYPDALQLDLVGAGDREPLRIAWAPTPNRRGRDIIVPPGAERAGLRPMKVEDRARILKAIARSRAWVDDLVSSRVAGTDAIAATEACSERAVRMMLPLAQLSPRIVRAIVDGRLPRGIGIRHLAELPASWAEQERSLGF